MRIIASSDIIQAVRRLSIEAACFLPPDVKAGIRSAYEREDSPLGQYCLQSVIENFEIAEAETSPICQDTGITVVFAEWGQEVQIDSGTLEDAVNEGVRQGYQEGYLRKSVVDDPVFLRKNTTDNTPAVLHLQMTEGSRLKITLLPKGAGCENMGAIKMLNPAEGVKGVKRFIIDTVKNAGGNPCPPIVVGVGIGGTMEKCCQLSKTALCRELGLPNPNPSYAALEQDLLCDINQLGIGPQGFGGKVTAMAVAIEYFPTHIASLPVAVSINCHAARHKQVIL